MTTAQRTGPASDADLFSPEVVADLFPVLARMRALGPAVYMTRHDFWLISRYDDVRAAAGDWKSFTSAKGVALTDEFNANLTGSVLATDPPEHDELRAVLSEKLAPRGLRHVRDQIRTYADELVGEVVERGTFDAAKDIAQVFPINVVADLVGLPAEGREKLHPGAEATFAGFGPFTQDMAEHVGEMQAYHELMVAMTDRDKLLPGGWGETIMDAVDDGRLTRIGAVKSISAYMTAGMDTTVNAIAALLRLFAERPEVWRQLREDPSRHAAAFEEILRLESPVTGFFRVTTGDVRIGDVRVPEGERVMLHWASANRDPDHFPDPDRYDLTRNPLDHVAFGYGIHGCAGQGLARMEVATLLEALTERVESFEIAGDVVRGANPVVRSLTSVPVTVTARS